MFADDVGWKMRTSVGMFVLRLYGNRTTKCGTCVCVRARVSFATKDPSRAPLYREGRTKLTYLSASAWFSSRVPPADRGAPGIRNAVTWLAACRGGVEAGDK